MLSAALSHPGRVRATNEDRFLLASDLGLYALADGMGGANAGERAAELALCTLEARFRNGARRDRQTLLDAFQQAHQRVREAGEADPHLEGMGTTLVAALETAGGLVIASVGDSRAYVCERGVLRLVTEDQTWVAETARELGLDQNELRNHPWRHVLTMAIGAPAPLEVHDYVVHLSPGDLVLLSSDGLHGVVDSQTIGTALNSEQSLAGKCHYLIEAALRAGGPDNITAVLLRAG